jgi:hypothetical protein
MSLVALFIGLVCIHHYNTGTFRKRPKRKGGE